MIFISHFFIYPLMHTSNSQVHNFTDTIYSTQGWKLNIQICSCFANWWKI